MEDYERRQASEEASMGRFGSLVGRYATLIGAVSAFTVMYLMDAVDDVSSEMHRMFSILLGNLDPDSARGAVLRLASWGLLPTDYDKDDPYLMIEPQEGLSFATPVGLAAGFDREAVGVTALLNLGFGFVEVGPVDAAALVSGDGGRGDNIRKRLVSRDKTGQVVHLGIVGIAVSGATARELSAAVAALGSSVEYVSVDIAALPAAMREDERSLRSLVADLVAASNEVVGGHGPAIFLRLASPERLAPTAEGRAAIARAAKAALSGGASGMILAHDEADFPAADADSAAEAAAEASEAVAEAYRASDGRLVLISAGRLPNGREALSRIEAGATVLQISSLLCSQGVQACRRIKNELSQMLMNDGYVSLEDAVGAAHRKKKRKKVKNVWKAK